MSSTDRISGVTAWAYDENGNLLSLTDSEGSTTSYTYNSRNLQITETFPDAAPNTVTFTYDYARRKATREDQLGDTITYAYDMANRLLDRQYPNNQNDTFTHDDASRMISAHNGRYNNTVTMDYEDGASRLTEEKLTTHGHTFTVASEYDDAGRRTKITYPDNSVVDRDYTVRGQLEQIDYATNMVASYAYDDGMRRTTRTLGDTPGTVTTWSHNRNDNLITGISVAGVSGVDFSYTYDVNKNKLKETINAPMANYGFNSSTNAVYDNEDRLTEWNRDDGNVDQSWNLSLAGDWDQFTENQTVQTRTHNDVHELTAIDLTPLAHDVKGNLTTNANGQVYTWDFDNRMRTALATGGTSNYRYNALGRRVSKTTPNPGGATIIFVYSNRQVLAEYKLVSALTPSNPGQTSPSTPVIKTTTTLLRKYVYAVYIDEPVLMLDRTSAGTQPAGTDELFYYHANNLYSIAALTDQSGTVQERYAYTAYVSVRRNT